MGENLDAVSFASQSAMTQTEEKKPEEETPAKATKRSKKQAEKPDLSRPSPQRRSVNRAINELVRWMPMGGSGFAFFSFLLKQEWMISLFLFPIMAASAIWAAYTKHFIEQLQEIYAERGKNDANAFVAWMDSLSETFQWQFSGFEGKYLKLQMRPCERYETEGAPTPDDVATPMLKDVFIPLSVAGYGVGGDFGPDRQVRRSRRAIERRPQTQSIWDILRRSKREPEFRQILIRKKGGFGKTTMLRHVALIYSLSEQGKYRAPDRVPFLLRLRDFASVWEQADIPGLPTLITDHHLKSLSRVKPLSPPPKWAEMLLESGRALVMLDGFDEVAQVDRSRVSQWLGAQMQEYREATFILTSRPAGFKDYVGPKPLTPISIESFTPDQQEEFIRRWYLCQERRNGTRRSAANYAALERSEDLITQLKANSELMKMAENPLLLNMITTFHRGSKTRTLPKRKAELYAGIIRLQLNDRPVARTQSMLLPYEKSLELLQQIALVMIYENTAIAKDDLLEDFLAQQSIFSEQEVSWEKWLRQIIDIAELLVERESGEFEFPHLSFQGYFAAMGLKTFPNQRQVVLEHWPRPWWQETILFYTAELPPAQFTAVLQAAREQGEAVELADQCLREYRREAELDPALRQEAKMIRVARYAELESLLKAGEWEKADRETYRLMITIVGREEGDYFREKDLQEFPCEDLLTIDQLWVTASDGHFGFSVQKKIWEECGSPMSYSDEWEKFGDRVGWRRQGDWMTDYANLQKNLSLSPAGEFPSVVVVWFGGWRVAELCGVLFSRRDL
jgi:hypothetical protein